MEEAREIIFKRYADMKKSLLSLKQQVLDLVEERNYLKKQLANMKQKMYEWKFAAHMFGCPPEDAGVSSE